MKESDGNDERKFLHDLASPLSTITFIVDAVLDRIQSRESVDPDEVAQLAEVHLELQRVKKLLEERRELLIQKGATHGRS